MWPGSATGRMSDRSVFQVCVSMCLLSMGSPRERWAREPEPREGAGSRGRHLTGIGRSKRRLAT